MANFNFNKIILGGRLTADPELKTTPSGISVTTFSIAVNKRVKEGEEAQADFFNVTAWRQTAEFITRYFRKASSICVVGELHNRSWVDQQGQKRYATEIVASEAFFVDAKSEMPQAAQAPRTQSYTPPASTPYVPEAYQTNMTIPDFSTLPDDEELPF
jgi:single-strand DNA-binding protein